jgi:hypothetical protein
MTALAVSPDGENFVIIPNYPDWALEPNFLEVGEEETCE